MYEWIFVDRHLNYRHISMKIFVGVHYRNPTLCRVQFIAHSAKHDLPGVTFSEIRLSAQT
jgi:hypothetical protein